MAAGRRSMGHGTIFVLFFLSTLSFQDVDANSSRSTAKISTILAHSVCSERTEFERSGVIQKPIKRKSDFQIESVKCGWLPLQHSGQTFYPCSPSQGQGQLRHDLGQDFDEDANSTVLTGSGLGLRELKEDKRNLFGFVKKRAPKPGHRLNGNTTAKPLPLAVAPQHYDIFLRPVLVKDAKWPHFSVPGRVSILLDVLEPTTKILLHRAERVENISVKLTQKSDNSEVPITAQSYDASEETHTIELASVLTVGKGVYELFFEYTTTMKNDRKGLFWQGYSDANGNFRSLAMTQMEFDRARYAFPVFEDPHFKATFSISVARTAGDNSRSNSPKAKTIEDPENPGWFIDSFEKTPKMSAYLVALTVSDYNCKAADPSIYPKIPVQFCGSTYDLDQGRIDFALNTSAHALKLAEATLKYSYEHSKMDGVTVPSFYGGMENWGLVFYNDVGMHVEYRIKPDSERTKTILVVVHEIVHQWVGNLVTCKSWNHTWLNEGLTTYMTAMFMSQLYPEIRPHDFVEDIRQVLKTDVAEGTPVGGPLASAEEIIYVKGGAILRMVESFMGKELFLEAIVEYIKRFAYKSVEQDDLFNVLHEFAQKGNKLASQQTIKGILEPWVTQTGRPLIRVEIGSSGSGQIKVSQELFVNKSNSTTSDTERLWDIPIYISSPKNPKMNGRSPDLWLSTATAEISMDVGPDSWYIFNTDAFGYYHVAYSDQLFNLILNQLAKDPNAISGASKSTLFFDYSVFYDQGYEKLEKLLCLTKYLTHESDPDVWNTFFKHFPHEIASRLMPFPEFREYWIPRIEKLLDYYGVEDVGDYGSTLRLRAFILEWSKSLVIPSFTARASAIVQGWKASGKPLSSVRYDFWGTIYCGAVADKDASQVEFLIKILQEHVDWGDWPNPLELFRVIFAVTCGQDPKIIQRPDLPQKWGKSGLFWGKYGCAFIAFSLMFIKALESIVNGEIFFRDANRFFDAMVLNDAARGLMLKFMYERFDDLEKALRRDFGQIVLNSLVNKIQTEDDRDTMAKILTRMLSGQQLADFIEVINSTLDKNVQWFKTYGNPALKWFSENK